MPRPLRVEYEGDIYRLLSRGDRREEVFWSDADGMLSISTLARACEKTGWEIARLLSYEQPFSPGGGDAAGEPGRGMKWLLGTYTVAFAGTCAGAIKLPRSRLLRPVATGLKYYLDAFIFLVEEDIVAFRRFFQA